MLEKTEVASPDLNFHQPTASIDVPVSQTPSPNPEDTVVLGDVMKTTRM
jgi:hypothetical protein